MRKTGYAVLALLAATVLVGAGCSGYQQAQVSAPEVRQKGSADAAVDAMINAGATEDSLQQDAANDANQYSADKTEINAYGDASYEPQ